MVLIPDKVNEYRRNWQVIDLFLNPGNTALTAPTVPATTVPLFNTTYGPVTIYISGGNVTVIAIGGTATGLTSGTFHLNDGQSIAITYTVVPTWTWFRG